MSSITFENVGKDFGTLTVLRDFNLEVPSGSMAVILGGSGSGKTTILKLVLGLVRPDRGQVRVGEYDIASLSEEELMPIRGQIGMVFQAGALFDSMTVGENVAYRLIEQKTHSEERTQQTVDQMLGFVGLAAAKNKLPSELSGGMRRRVAIARALVGSPLVMLYDEPTAGLDPITSRTICELMMRLRDLEKVTSVFVTHDLKAAMSMAREMAVEGKDGGVTFVRKSSACAQQTRFVILKEGRVLLEGNEEDLAATSDEYIREFLD